MAHKHLKRYRLLSSAAVLAVGIAALSAVNFSGITQANQGHLASEAGTQNQAVYEVDRYGFQFSYSPSQFVVVPSQQAPLSNPSALSTINIWTKQHYQKIKSGAYQGSEYPANVTVSVHRNPQQLPLQQWVQQNNWFVQAKGFQERAGSTELDPNGTARQKGLFFTSTGLYERENIVFKSPKDSNIIVISLAKTNYGNSDAIYRKAFSAAISSLKPIEVKQPSNRGESFLIRGNEPFWSVTVSTRGIVYSTPESSKLTFSYIKPMSAEGRTLDMMRVYRLQGQSNGFLLIKRGACNDTMSDQKYDYSATLILGNRVQEGCALKQ